MVDTAISQVIYNTTEIKSRLIRKCDDWYVAEYKTPEMPNWMPWICGTSEFLMLTKQEKGWAKNG